MAEKLRMTCPCGFSFVTPHGEDDEVAVRNFTLSAFTRRITRKESQ